MRKVHGHMDISLHIHVLLVLIQFHESILERNSPKVPLLEKQWAKFSFILCDCIRTSLFEIPYTKLHNQELSIYMTCRQRSTGWMLCTEDDKYGLLILLFLTTFFEKLRPCVFLGKELLDLVDTVLIFC